MTLKYLFLDIDGVLNSEAYFAAQFGGTVQSMEESWLARRVGGASRVAKQLDPAAIARLNTLLGALPNVRLVLSSSWRLATGYDVTREALKLRGFQHDDRFVGVTPVEDGCRGEEIATWMAHHNVAGWNVAIVDDNADMGAMMDRLVRTDWQFGLQSANCLALRKLLAEAQR